MIETPKREREASRKTDRKKERYTTDRQPL